MISEELIELRDFTQERKFKQYRKNIDINLRQEFKNQKMSLQKRSAYLLKTMCEMETPIVFENEKITFTRTIRNIPAYYNNRDIKKTYHPKKGVSYDVFHNATPNWEILLEQGLSGRLKIAQEGLQTAKGKEKEFLESAIIAIESVLNLSDRYAECAKSVNNETVAKVISNVPRNGANSFHEALQSLRFISSMFYLNNNYQFGFGRMDQYLYPYYKKEIEENTITKKEAKNLLCEFFISLNKDADLYNGVQQGDNGQTVMLGGVKSDGLSGINDLTYLIMEISRDLKLIDPKINLRIDSNTPEDLLELGCELTKVGLGFPQYSNDEVVIPALVKKGYSLEDAREYTVAACWEFIIPGKALEIVNQGALSFPAAVDNAFQKTVKIPYLFSMKKLRNEIKKDIKKQILNIKKNRDVRTLPSPFASLFFDGALEKHLDASISAKYKNIGIHGAGSSNAADALAAIKYFAEKKDFKGLKQLRKAINHNFEGYKDLQNKLLNEMPKVGNDNKFVDSELTFLFNSFADAAEEIGTNNQKIRPGSGSAMYYLWLTTDNRSPWIIEPIVGATAEGRKLGEALSTSLAPSHGIKVDGLLSTLKSFSNIDYSRIMNGGPITVELVPSVLNSDEGIKKLAKLIRYFVQLGNQQLQLNVLDVATLEDAIANPEKHKNLIVRVWGWSGYFCELAPEYQQHIINRHKYLL